MAQTLMEAVELSIEVWSFLTETGKNKEDLPVETYDKIRFMSGRCPLCEYRLENSQGHGCGSCILRINGLFCGEQGHPFKMWKALHDAEQESDIKLKKELAGKIASRLKCWRQERTERRY